MNDKQKQQIKQSIVATKQKRRSQKCRVFTLKIDESRLNAKEREQLKMFFVEAKWLYNNILASNDPFHYDCKSAVVTILNKDKQPEQKQLQFLTNANQYRIKLSLQQNIINLSKAKKKGLKVSKLKFKSSINSINLYRYGITHHISGHNRLKIAGIKRHLIVRGLKQIQEHFELANAKLLKKPSGYYIKIICYEFIKPNMLPTKTKEGGLDFGIKNNITTSEGEVYNVSVEETERLKLLQKKLARQVKHSNNSYKTKLLINLEYEKITNKKADTANKIVHTLLTNFSFIYMQDENIKSWHTDRRFSKNVQHSCMSLIKKKLAKSDKVKMISKWYPTTKQCYICSRINILTLSDRIYKCECGLVEDRDIKAAKTIMLFGKNQLTPVRVPMERREFKSAEKFNR